MVTPDERVHSLHYLAATKKEAFKCYDCARPCGEYIVKDEVWRAAWPDYYALKRRLLQEYPTMEERWHTYLQLCYRCFIIRLGRPLVLADFRMETPCNDGIRIGLLLAEGQQRESTQEARAQSKDPAMVG
jgi:hypothetical protein